MNLNEKLNNITKRKSVESLENILEKEFKILDHGFLRVIDYMGDDSSIVQAARVSYGSGTKHVNEDRGLIRYLMKHRHSTPFEMCEIKFHVKLPIFVARQWIRHRTANVNEYSARYSILDKEFYIPDISQMCEQSKINNQGRGYILNEDVAEKLRDVLIYDSINAHKNYQESLDKNLARELSRIGLSLNYYTQWYWKIDLHNLLHFVSLRADPHAQYEIRVYAIKILDIIKEWVPLTHEAFMDYRMDSKTISTKEIQVLKKWIKGEQPDQIESGLSKREWSELCEIFEKI